MNLIGFFVKLHINLCRLFNTKAIVQEERLWCYLTNSWGDKRVHTFPKGVCPIMNVIAWLEYELAYYDSAIHRFNHYTTRTPPVPLEFETAYSNARVLHVSHPGGYPSDESQFLVISYSILAISLSPFGRGGFYEVSTHVGNLMPNPFNIYIYIYTYNLFIAFNTWCDYNAILSCKWSDSWWKVWLFELSWFPIIKIYSCNILTFDPAINRGTGASGRRYQGITLTVDGLNWVQMRRSQEAGGRQTMI